MNVNERQRERREGATSWEGNTTKEDYWSGEDEGTKMWAAPLPKPYLPPLSYLISSSDPALE